MLSALVLTACSAEKFEGDAPKDWDGNLMLFAPTEDASFSTYYMPEIGRVGDPMPFYDQKAGEFKVLYLQEFNNNDPYCYHPFYGVSTKDGANYQGLGEGWYRVAVKLPEQNEKLLRAMEEICNG